MSPPAENQTAREVALTIRRLSGLSILPAVAAKAISELFEMNLSPSRLTGIAESDPALAALILSQSQQPNIHLAVEQVPLRELRDRLLSAPVYLPFDNDGRKLTLRRELISFSVAVGLCARLLAEETSLGIDPDLTYAAGLLHNLGNLALDETMPRSFTAMLEQARQQHLSIAHIQQQNLGLDYTILGKRLARKMHLDEQIMLAAWLHLSEPNTIAQVSPESHIPLLVRLAYLMARRMNVGEPATYDQIPNTDQLAASLFLTTEQVEQITGQAQLQLHRKLQSLGRDLPTDTANYCRAVRTAAGQLSEQSSKLARQLQSLQTKSSHFDFAAEFLAGIDPEAEPIEIAERFACHFKKFYQTGNVCIYLTEPQSPDYTQAVVFDGDAPAKMIYLKMPADASIVPDQNAGGFGVSNAAGEVDWLFEQLEVEFDREQTKIVPLISKGTALGAIVFEFRYPVETDQLHKMFGATSFIAAAVLDLAFAQQKQQHLTEKLIQTPPAEPAPQRPTAKEHKYADYILALTEMAGGAAHELNNPLSVIAARAQLLSQSETDPAKTEALKQIQENAHELSAIVQDLMRFADPTPPRKSNVGVRQLLDEAVQLTCHKTGAENINLQTTIGDDIGEVIVDSAQIVSALANILANAIESYRGELGPIKVTAEKDTGLVTLQINDLGCGMDTVTLEKAIYPFFSAKPAGRKRGMGLAHAARLIHLNGGTLNITSIPDTGTTATITLPRS